MLLVALTVAGFLVVRHLGAALAGAGGRRRAGVAAIPATSSSVLLRLLIGAHRRHRHRAGAGDACSPCVRQPPVIGEILAGILLGPSLLGAEASALGSCPADVAPYLGVIAQVGVVLYMFLVGLELDDDAAAAPGRTRSWRSRTRASSCRSCSAPRSRSCSTRGSRRSDVPFTAFALFMGVAMSITAFPVLARILTDRGMTQTPLGVMALSLRGGRRRDGLVPARLRRRRGAARRSAMPCVVTGGALAFIAFMLSRRPSAAGALGGARPTSAADRPAAVALVFVGAAAVGARHRGHRHPRGVRRVLLGAIDAARQSPRPRV